MERPGERPHERVLPRPGTPSSSTCPPAIMAITVFFDDFLLADDHLLHLRLELLEAGTEFLEAGLQFVGWRIFRHGRWEK